MKIKSNGIIGSDYYCHCWVNCPNCGETINIEFMKVRKIVWVIIFPFLFGVGITLFIVELILRILLNFIGFFMPFEDEIRFFSMKEDDFITNKVFNKIMDKLCG